MLQELHSLLEGSYLNADEYCEMGSESEASE